MQEEAVFNEKVGHVDFMFNIIEATVM